MIPGRAETTEQKREILARLAVLWERFPQLRLGQLIGNVYYSTDPGGCMLYFAEDYKLIEELESTYAPELSLGTVPGVL